jgi:hypothetical protein
VFPSGERSGVNLRGDINVENTTTIEDCADSDPQDVIYRTFWKIQFFMYHPVQALMADNWTQVKHVLPSNVTNV